MLADTEILKSLQQTTGLHCVFQSLGSSKSLSDAMTQGLDKAQELGWEYVAAGFLDKPFRNKWVQLFGFRTALNQYGFVLFWYDTPGVNYWFRYVCSEEKNVA